VAGAENRFQNPRTARETGAQSGQCGTLAGRVQEQCNQPATNLNIGGRTRGPRTDYPWEKTFSAVARTAGAGVVLFLLLVPLLKELRIRSRYARARDGSAQTAAAFHQFMDDAAELATPRLPSESASSYVVRLGRADAVNRSDAERLAALYERAEYAAEGADKDDARRARRLARSLRSSLWRRARWWNRAVRLFSPVRLFAGRARPRRRWAFKPARSGHRA
jgi:hypothetical protein